MNGLRQQQRTVQVALKWMVLLSWTMLIFACQPDEPPASMGKELLINGGFEIPQAPKQLGATYTLGSAKITATELDIIGGITPGSEPPGFGWRVEANDVDLVAFGYDSSSGDGYVGQMAEGRQHLDLDGYRPGTLVQTIPTEVGGLYALTFAYANNPDVGVGHPYLAQVTVVDAASGADLITPLDIAHTGSTTKNYFWTRAGPITFTARGENTILRFTSRNIASSRHGIALDDVSVKVISRPVFFTNRFERYALPVAAVVALALIARSFAGNRRENDGQPSE